MRLPPDCERIDRVVRRMLVGVPVDKSNSDHAVAHVATCPRCRTRFDLAESATCEAVGDDLLEASTMTDIEQLDARYPGLARHLEGCPRCRALLTRLIAADVNSVADEQVDVARIFEGALGRALGSAEPIARRRAAEWINRDVLARLSGPLRAKLTRLARRDPDIQVRRAARAALTALPAGVRGVGAVAEPGRTAPR